LGDNVASGQNQLQKATSEPPVVATISCEVEKIEWYPASLSLAKIHRLELELAKTTEEATGEASETSTQKEESMSSSQKLATKDDIESAPTNAGSGEVEDRKRTKLETATRAATENQDNMSHNENLATNCDIEPPTADSAPREVENKKKKDTT
jgi:hypothetical protein